MWADRHGGQIGALSTAASHSGHGQGIEASEDHSRSGSCTAELDPAYCGSG